MVNKQYNVQNHHHSGGGGGGGGGKRYSPPPIRNLSIISDTPNPSSSQTFPVKEKYCGSDGEEAGNDHCDDLTTTTIHPDHRTQSTYGRNIGLYNRGEINNSRTMRECGSGDHENDQRFSVKELSINDIGRFQYILQMDREMGSHPDTLYRIPSRIQKTSSNNSVNSNNHINFWKAGSESPMTSSTTESRRRRQEIYRHLKDFWKYAKWPLVLLLCCIVLGCVVAYLVASQHNLDESNDQMIVANVTNLQPPDGLIGELNHLDQNSLEEDIEMNVEDQETEDIEEVKDGSRENDQVLNIYMRNPKVTTTEKQIFTAPVHVTTTEEDEEVTIYNSEIQKEENETSHPISVTTTSPFRNTQILKIINQDKMKIEDDVETPTTEHIEKDKKFAQPTKETLQVIGFTSGHQNNFGVPIEEDERILRILNEELIRLEQNETTHRPTTDSSIYKARVSPTLPVIFHHRESTTEGVSAVFNTTDVGQCESTSLGICRGILHYDLTISKAKRRLTVTELEHFRYLFDSKCSTRAAEFVCSALEPECRPTQMGILQPCKRICKSILEPCASIIASSEILTMTFDCDKYPDSSDRNVCEDPTRRGKCHDNEFKCLDSSCIPHQWKCDNIKDCSLGEDEDNCLFCEHEEFRCQTNDKCIPDKWRCDQYDDCPDGSDEADCFDYEEDGDGKEEFGSPRIYSFASIQSPDNPNSKPYLTISEEERLSSAEKLAEQESEKDQYLPSAAENIENLDEKQSNEAAKEEDEIQTGEASGRLITSLPKNIANFQDSKEIMMTSDSENDFKYSAINRTVTATTTDQMEETTTKNPHCPENQLRCVSGKCITVAQICDRTIDCPDGADEAMCVYKDQ